MTLRVSSTLRILVVDDNTLNLKVARATLKHLGYDPDEARSGLEALTALETKEYDLIFMDIQMPEMDGLDATRQIRARHADRPIAIIALTADGDRPTCLAAGMNEHLPKPISIKALKTMIDGLFVAA
jgi:two-component system sensor histidine kinase/response regulator